MIDHFLWACINCLLVVFESICEVLLFVVFSSSCFVSFCLLLYFELFSLFSWKSSFFCLFSFSLIFSFFCSSLSSSLLLGLFIICIFFHLLFLNIHKIDTSEFLEYIHESWIRLNQLHEHLRVGLAHLPHTGKLRILKVFSDSWISSQFSLSLWSTKHVAHASSWRSLWSESSSHSSSHGLCLLISHYSLHSTLNLSIIWIDLKTSLISLIRLLELIKTV